MIFLPPVEVPRRGQFVKGCLRLTDVHRIASAALVGPLDVRNGGAIGLFIGGRVDEYQLVVTLIHDDARRRLT